MAANQKMGVVFSDHHFPFHDPSLCRQGLNFVKKHKPHFIHLLGDVLDCYQLSKFSKDPERKFSLQDELDQVYRYLQTLRKAAPNAIIIYFEGNHEHRLTKYLRNEATALSSLRDLTLPSLLKLDKLNIQYQAHDEPYYVGPMLFTHGEMIRSQSAYTAKGHLDKFGCDVLHGHSHKMGAHYKTNVTGVKTAWENGCMCLLKQDYLTMANWQQGWSVVWTLGDFVHIDPVHVINGRYHYHGVLYGKPKASTARVIADFTRGVTR